MGYDAGKKVKGRKVHALVDTEGLPLRVVVHSAAARAGRPDPFPIFVMVFVALALVAGGSSSDPLSAGVTRIGGVPILAIAIERLADRGVPTGARWPLFMLAVAFGLAILQLLPMPPELWRGLPGRRILTDGFSAAGIAPPWLPLSVAPAATWDACLGFIPFAALFCAMLTLEPPARRALLVVVVIIALGSIALGMLQTAGGPASRLRLYAITNPESPVGFFANRNHQAAFLACTLPLAAVLARRSISAGAPPGFFGGIALAAFALVVVVGTALIGSRAGALLLVLGALGAVALLVRSRSPMARRVWRWWPAAAMVVAAVLAAILVAGSRDPILAKRFGAGLGDDLRFDIAAVAGRAGLAVAPWGSGVGSFSIVYQIFEPWAAIRPTLVNHAHDDFLEVWVECGVPGVILFCAFLVWWLSSTWSCLSATGNRAFSLPLAGAIIIGMLLVHSMVDYPLRTPALASLFALACGLLTPTHSDPRGARNPGVRRRGHEGGS